MGSHKPSRERDAIVSAPRSINRATSATSTRAAPAGRLRARNITASAAALRPGGRGARPGPGGRLRRRHPPSLQVVAVEPAPDGVPAPGDGQGRPPLGGRLARPGARAPGEGLGPAPVRGGVGRHLTQAWKPRSSSIASRSPMRGESPRRILRDSRRRPGGGRPARSAALRRSPLPRPDLHRDRA